MAMIMHRSFADFMGFNWPPEIAYKVDGIPVTYKELKAERVKEQAEHLEYILRNTSPVKRAAYIWVFFNPHFPYEGWHLYLRTIKDDWWIRDCDELALSIMRMFPCGLLPIPENFHRWKKAFAKTYARPSKRGIKQGMVIGWVEVINGRRPDAFYMCSPQPEE